MTFDFQTAFNVALAIGGFLASFVLNQVFARISEARREAASAHMRAERAEKSLGEHKLYAAEHYLPVRRFEGFEERLFAELKAIRDSLDAKADKD